MRIKMTVSIASTEGWSYAYGQELVVGKACTPETVTKNLADAWIGCGHAVAIDGGSASGGAAKPRSGPRRASE